MRAATLISMLPPDLQHVLIQQADKIEDYKSNRDRVATIVEAKLALKNPDAMECDAVHQSTGHAEAWEDNSEACDFNAVNSKSGAAKCATPAPTKEKPNMEEREEKQEARAAATRRNAKESGMDSAPTAGRRVADLAIAGPSRRTRRITGRQTSGRLRRISADSKSAAWTKKKCTRQGCIFPTGSRH